MKVSKKTEYGLRFLLALAELGEGKFMGIYQISLRHTIPMKFLEAIAVQLKKFGMLEVKKGAGGGYRLKYPPSKINLLMVFECLEDATRKDFDMDGDLSSNQKAVASTLNGVLTDVRNTLESKTLSDIQSEYRNLNESLMYYI